MVRSSYWVTMVSTGRRSLRRRFDGAHFARAGQREVKRARDRRGGERQDIDGRAQFFEALLVQHAEALLLVDHHQTEVL